MKHNILILILIGILSCNNQHRKTDKEINIDNISQKMNTENSKCYTHQDTIFIATERGDTLKIEKAEFNNIIDKHPEFFEEYPDNPDQAYYNDNDREEFASEVGQDFYYILYAYFLKQRNGVEKYAKQREKLINIYSIINSLYGHFEYGGTYFGHQEDRILGYTEYSIYILSKTENEISKTYDIKTQKAIYIKSLRQLVKDESKIDFNTLGKAKLERNKKLNKLIDELEKLITDIFYLRRTQEFQYGHYEYY